MSTIFDNYTDPDIPGIFMSVTDNSIQEAQPEATRSVFMAMPLKYGSENIMPFTTTQDLDAAVGSENSFKYGKGQFYARSFIEAGATVYIKKIDDITSTYANILLRRSNEYFGLLSGTTPDYTKIPFDAVNFKNVLEKDTLIQTTVSETDAKNQVVAARATLATLIASGTATTAQISAAQADLATKEALSAIYYNKTETVLSFLAKGRGAGYNDLFAIFKNAGEYEKFDATDEGIINYKFNFINMEIFENNSYTTEIKKKSKTTLVSLMDIDPITKNMITHKSNGSILWINDIVGNSNFYMTAKINPVFQNEIRNYPNIDSVLADKNKPFFFVESSDTISDPTLTMDQRKWYEVSVNDSVSPATFRIQRATIIGSRQITAQPVFEVDVAGVNTLYQASIKDTNARLTLEFSVFNPTGSYTPTYTLANGLAYLDGDNAFYQAELKYDATTSNVIFTPTPFRFLRWELYSTLMRYNIKLGEGTDNTSSSGFVNLDGSANIDAIANGIYEYVRDDKEIREVIYPKFTFNYLIDWTDTIKVKEIYFKLADRIRKSMHIASCSSIRLNSTGLSPDYSVDNDILCREQYLTSSSYNTMLYSSQQNKTHFDNISKQTYKLPSSFYALLDHIYVDQQYSITEPVANIEKGIIRTSNLTLSHEIYSEDIADLRKLQINCIVTDGSDNYFIDQLTAYKKTSKLSLGNVVKTLQHLQTVIPKRLRKYLQKKETDVAITSNVLNEVQEIIKPYKATTNSEDAIFKDVIISPKFDGNILTITIRVTPAGTTEKINVPIIVQS